MKPLLVLARITFVGCLWSIIFIEGVRVIMLENWRFDIFWPPHWLHAWNLWSSGWVIDTPKEWAFVLLIATFIPLWLTGWVGLSLIPWEHIFYKLILFPVNLLYSIFNPLKIATKTPVVVKKRSYKEIRPTGPRVPIYDYSDNSVSAPSGHSPSPVSVAPKTTTATIQSNPIKAKASAARETFSHSLFNLDDEDDDFDLDFGSFEKSDIFSIDNKNKKDTEGAVQQRKFKSSATMDIEDADSSRDYDDEDDRSAPYDEEEYLDRGQRRNRYEDEDGYTRRNNKNEREQPVRKTDNDKNDRRDKRRPRDDSRDDYDTRDNRRADNNRNRQETFSEKNNRNNNASPQQRSNPVADVLQQKGYDIISGITIKNTMIDFVAVSSDKICLCLIDKESGDWLADEERFNDEEPLWFSENSHRISPIRKIDKARDILTAKLNSHGFNFEIRAYVIIQAGNIINAEDMFDVWNNMDVEVTRINRGSPKEIKLFSRSVEDADEKLEKAEFETLRKIIRNIA